MSDVTIGVAVLNWNGRADTLACLESLARAQPGPETTVVVDNGSTDDSVTAIGNWIRSRAPGTIELLASSENRGFAAGNNIALARLAADRRLTHFLLLNNDATVDRSFFADLRHALHRYEADARAQPELEYEQAGYNCKGSGPRRRKGGSAAQVDGQPAASPGSKHR